MKTMVPMHGLFLEKSCYAIFFRWKGRNKYGRLGLASTLIGSHRASRRHGASVWSIHCFPPFSHFNKAAILCAERKKEKKKKKQGGGWT